MTRGR